MRPTQMYYLITVNAIKLYAYDLLNDGAHFSVLFAYQSSSNCNNVAGTPTVCLYLPTYFMAFINSYER